jgi:hypothetical protein
MRLSQHIGIHPVEELLPFQTYTLPGNGDIPIPGVSGVRSDPPLKAAAHEAIGWSRTARKEPWTQSK